jgi:hypothetical protein
VSFLRYGKGESKKYDYEDSRLKAQKFVRYKEGCKLYAMGMSKFQEIAKEAGAIYKINQMYIVINIFRYK